MTFMALSILASCTQGEGEGEALYLKCAGTSIDLVSNQKAQSSFLVKIGPEQGLGNSLLFYSDPEKRFKASACKINFTNCALIIKTDDVVEIGMMYGSDNSALLTKRTEINRRTGSYRETSRFHGEGDRVTFEGQCTKSEKPSDVPRQF